VSGVADVQRVVSFRAGSLLTTALVGRLRLCRYNKPHYAQIWVGSLLSWCCLVLCGVHFPYLLLSIPLCLDTIDFYLPNFDSVVWYATLADASMSSSKLLLSRTVTKRVNDGWAYVSVPAIVYAYNGVLNENPSFLGRKRMPL
jgi:hypothetical protein